MTPPPRGVLWLQELGPVHGSGRAGKGELQGSAEFAVSALGMWHPPGFAGTLVSRGAEGSLGHRHRALESRRPSVRIQRGT